MADAWTIPSQAGARPAQGVVARLREALLERQRRHQEQEIGRFIESHGGVLTDEVEREIGCRFGAG